MYKTLHRKIRFLFPLAIFFFLAKIIFSQWNQVKAYPWEFDFILLATSFALVFLTLFFVVVLWRYIMRQLECELSLSKSFRIFHLSNLGRYVPGKIWQFVGMFYMLENENIGISKATSGIVWTNLFFNLSGLILGVITLFFVKHEFHTSSVIILFCLILSIVILIQPRVLERILARYLKKYKLDESKFFLSGTEIFKNMIFYTGLWILYGSGFFLLTKSAFEIPINLFPVFIGLFAAAHVIGYLSFLAPGGIGVREGVLTYLLSHYVPLPVATIISVLARLWLTIAELVFAGFALKMK